MKNNAGLSASQIKRNRFTFGIGTLGRDMVYALFSMFLLIYLTEVLALPAQTLGWITAVIVAARIFDAVTDPVMGVVVDNTKTKWGRFKPWLVVGMISSPILTVLLFTDFGLSGAVFVLVFAVIYVLWGIAYTTHDISYWSMLPTLSLDQKERERIGAIARICANIGLFIVVAGIVPVTDMIARHLASASGQFAAVDIDVLTSEQLRPFLIQAYQYFAIAAVIIMVLFMLITVFGVKEPGLVHETKATPFREMIKIIFKNDQLLCVAIAMSLFMIGYVTTTSFGVHFFTYVYGDVNMFAVFAVILGVSQIGAQIVFPLVSKHMKRKSLFTLAMILVAAGYIIFFFAPTYTMLFIGIAGVLLFVGQGFIQVLMLMFLADSVDYGHWKLGKRNDSISFSLQPFVNKMGAAIASGIFTVTLIVSGIQDARTPEAVAPEGLVMMRFSMLIIPMILIALSYFIWRFKYKIDESFHEQILTDLKSRGELE